mmetsp:Transcript_13030/g.22952  ORF Transcript_13030/g.22952 Transcript_13030/m.22952 type:complete len:123 (-) Transcript_13030:193-561(-)
MGSSRSETTTATRTGRATEASHTSSTSSFTRRCPSWSMFHDLVEIQVVELHEPLGWVTIPLFAIDDKTGDQAMLRAHFLQICVVSMHQNGRDTHIRQCKVFGPRRVEDDFSTVEFSQFSTLR